MFDLFKWVFVFLVTYPVSILATEHAITFNLAIDPDNPYSGIFSADTSELSVLTLLKPRVHPVLSTKNATDFSCINENRTEQISFGVPIHCDFIEWPITFDGIGSQPVDVSEQKNIFSKVGWRALFEWGVVPRLKETKAIDVCVNHTNSNQQACWQLPELNQPPLLIIWGTPGIEFKVGKQKMIIFTDHNGKQLINNKTIEILKSQFEYLTNLLAATQTSSSTIHLAWVGIEKKWRAVGGAAGMGAYIANYVTEASDVDESSQQRLFWISGHETFHMLTTSDYPLWMSESLAHYYGFKSLSKQNFTQLNPVNEWNKEKSRLPFAQVGLYEAHTRVIENNEMMYYALFYGKGAAFWYELDSYLGEENESLDTYIYLLNQNQAGDLVLNESFVQAIMKVIGRQKYNQLKTKYLSI